MALRSAEDFSCPICLEIFKDPVVLSCSHSFCKDCLQTCWTHTAIHQCPLCKRRSSKSEPPCNLALRNLCEAFVRELSLGENTPGDDLCRLHSEKLRLFCLDHQQPACLVCRDSRIHTDHRFRPIDEAAQDYRESLRNDLKPLQEKLERLSQVKADWYRTSEQIKTQAKIAETCMKNEFQMLRNFLQKEEEARIAALREEESQKSRMAEQQLEALSRKIKALSETIRAIENELQTADISFLQKYKAAAERVTGSSLPDDPHLPSGTLINMAKHMGNLTFNIWNSMKSMVTYSPVILDPNSAISSLLLDADLRGVRYTESQTRLPNNPERFDCYTTVVGSESFDSGTHSWIVDVSISANWSMGMIRESVKRKGEAVSGYWELWFDNGKYRAYAPPHTDIILTVKKPIQRIKVYLDWNRGKLSFIDMETNTIIYMFSQTFTERLFPYVNTLSKHSMRILPLRIRKINFDK